MSASGEGIDLRSADADPVGSLFAPLASRRTLMAEYLAAFRQMRLDDALELAGLGAPIPAITLPIPTQLKRSIPKNWPNHQFGIADLDPEGNSRSGWVSARAIWSTPTWIVKGRSRLAPPICRRPAQRSGENQSRAQIGLGGFAPEPQKPTPSKIPATPLPHEADDWPTRIARPSSGRRLRGAQS